MRARVAALAEIEAWLRYAVTPAFRAALGGRYRALSATGGTVQNGLAASQNPVTCHEQRRYGTLIEGRYGF